MLYKIFAVMAVLAIPLALSASHNRNDKVDVDIETSKGTISLELWRDKAPKTVDNFVRYAKEGFYEGTVFHRVISGFMIQGGGMDEALKGKKTRDAIQNEATNREPNERGTVAMARTSDINSATAQFFINVANNNFLNHRDTSNSGYGYCVFGKVTQGMDVVDAIAEVKTGSRGYYQDVPVDAIVITGVRVK